MNGHQLMASVRDEMQRGIAIPAVCARCGGPSLLLPPIPPEIASHDMRGTFLCACCSSPHCRHRRTPIG